MKKREEHVDVARNIQHTTIREVPHIVKVQKEASEEVEVGLDVSLPPVMRPFVIHDVEVDAKVRLVPGEQQVFEDQEVVEVLHDVYVPKTDVRYVDQEVRVPKEVVVKHVRERAVIVPEIREETKRIVQNDTTIVQNIRYMPKVPLETEWVPSGIAARERSGSPSRRFPQMIVPRFTSADMQENMWYELNILRNEHSYLVKRNQQARQDLEASKRRVEQLRRRVAEEKRVREGQQEQLRSREQEVRKVQLAPLPVKTESSFEVDRLMNTPSTIFRSHDVTGISSIASPDMSRLSAEFDRMDVNGDGVITRSEFLFDRLDRNHDGVITRDEFRRGLGLR